MQKKHPTNKHDKLSMEWMEKKLTSMHRLDLIEASLNYSAAMFQHSDTNNVLKNALPIINHFTKCHTVSNSAANYSVHCFFFLNLFAQSLRK